MKILVFATGPSSSAFLWESLIILNKQGHKIFGSHNVDGEGKIVTNPFLSRIREGGPFGFESWFFKKTIIKRMIDQYLREKPDFIISAGYVPGMEWLWKKAEFSNIRNIHLALPISTEIPPAAVGLNNKLRLAATIMPLAHHYGFAGAETFFVGHPAMDSPLENQEKVAKCKKALEIPDNAMVLGLFPGSTVEEIRTFLPIMANIAEKIRMARGRIAPVICLNQWAFDSGLNNCKSTLSQAMAPMKRTRLSIADTKTNLAMCRVALLASGNLIFEAIKQNIPFVELAHKNSAPIALGKKLGFIPCGMAQLAAPSARTPFFLCGLRPQELEKKGMIPLNREALIERIAAKGGALMVDRQRRERIQEDFKLAEMALSNKESVAQNLLKLIFAIG